MKYLNLPRHTHYFHTHEDFFVSSYDLVHAFLMKDYDIGLHEQEFYEINIVTSGAGLHYINNHEVEASVGDVFIVPPKVPHGYIGGADFDVFHIILSDKFMNKYIADLQKLPSFYVLFGAEPLMRGRTKSPLHLRLTSEVFHTTSNILWEISAYKNHHDTVECLIRSNFALITIGLLCNDYTKTNDSNDPKYFKDRAIMESISYIHEHYYDKISVDDLSRIAQMSRSSYMNKFKEICKISPSAYITKIRIEAAAAMLTSTNLPITEIAVRTGFYDSSHFTKTFENFYSLSPTEYRNKNLILQ